MRKSILSLAAVSLALVAMSLPLHAFTASATNALPENSIILGNEDIGDIRGNLERTIQFEVIPGEEFTFDMNLANVDWVEHTSDVMLRLINPNGGQRVFYNEEITLQGRESYEESFAQIIPETELYGRYTIHLIINSNIADVIQFDLNSRTDITVRWDDGVMANAYAWYDAGNKWAIRGCMPDGAVIDEIACDVLSEDDPYWPWPDGVHQAIELQVWDDTGSGGLPGTMLFNARVTPTDEAHAFPGIAAPANAFYVAQNQLDPYPGCEGQNVDGALNYADQMFAEIAGVWQNYTSISGDLMIWGVGHYGTEIVTFGTQPVE